jgi:hypothetical protein
MDFELAREVADAVLFEGHALWPYRVTSRQNRVRWGFGVLAPRAWSEAGGSEPWWTETRCLIEPTGATRVEGRLRFLHARSRQVERATPEGFVPVDRLDVEDALWTTWDEDDVREVPFACTLAELVVREVVVPFALAGDEEVQLLPGRRGGCVGRVVRARRALTGVVRLSALRVEGDRPLWRLDVRVENHTGWEEVDAPRAVALGGSCLGTHVLLAVGAGSFVSLLDPPPWAVAAAEDCRRARSFPVLAGLAGRRDVVLASPVVLVDHPRVTHEVTENTPDTTTSGPSGRRQQVNRGDGARPRSRATERRSPQTADMPGVDPWPSRPPRRTRS